MGTGVIARVSDELAQEIEFFAKEDNVDRSTEIRQLLTKAMEEKRIEYALEKYQKREVTLWKAATLAKVPLAMMMSLAAKRHIPLSYDLDDLKDDLKAVQKAK